MMTVLCFDESFFENFSFSISSENLKVSPYGSVYGCATPREISPLHVCLKQINNSVVKASCIAIPRKRVWYLKWHKELRVYSKNHLKTDIHRVRLVNTNDVEPRYLLPSSVKDTHQSDANCNCNN